MVSTWVVVIVSLVVAAIVVLIVVVLWSLLSLDVVTSGVEIPAKGVVGSWGSEDVLVWSLRDLVLMRMVTVWSMVSSLVVITKAICLLTTLKQVLGCWCISIGLLSGHWVTVLGVVGWLMD